MVFMKAFGRLSERTEKVVMKLLGDTLLRGIRFYISEMVNTCINR